MGSAMNLNQLNFKLKFFILKPTDSFSLFDFQLIHKAEVVKICFHWNFS